MKASARITHGEPALELFDAAVNLLRRAPAQVHLVYLAGTVPFLLGLLWFATDMSRGALADQRCAAGAAGLAALYLLMKTGHAVHASLLRRQVSLDPGRPWTPGRVLSVALTQSWIHPVLILLAPFTVFPLLMIPVPWLLAFAHGVVIEAEAGDGHTGRVLARAWRQTRRWPGQLHAIVGLLIPLAFLVWIQAAIALVSGPWLLRTFLGVESEFTLSLAAMLNTTFLLAVTAVAYLVLDPLVRAVFVLRTFHVAGLTSGEDLRVRLRRQRAGSAAAMVAALALLAGLPVAPRLHAADASPTTPAPPAASPRTGQPASAPAPANPGVARDLDQAIREVLERSEYRWRAPREFTPEEPEDGERGWIRWLRKRLDRLGNWLGDAFQGFFNRLDRWLRRLFGAPTPPALPQGNTEVDWVSGVKLLLVLLAAAAVGWLGWYLLQRQRRRSPATVTGASAAGPAAMPDLRAENVRADALPEEEWLALARELAARGEYRLAVRACHLALLAHLARRELVRLATHKSNRDYARELQRRAARQPELLQAFTSQTARFDRVWYGEHPAGASEVAEGELCLARLRENVP